MGGQGVLLCDADCECHACPCPGGTCSHCECPPLDVTVTFTGISLTECIEPPDTDLTYRLVGDLDVVNGTFCLDVVAACDYGYYFPTGTLKVMRMQDGNCDLVLEEGLERQVLIRVCRGATSWRVSIVGVESVMEVVMFYAEIETADCETGGEASSELSSGNGTVFDIPACSDFDSGGGFEHGSGGSVTLTPCCA